MSANLKRMLLILAFGIAGNIAVLALCGPVEAHEGNASEIASLVGLLVIACCVGAIVFVKPRPPRVE